MIACFVITFSIQRIKVGNSVFLQTMNLPFIIDSVEGVLSTSQRINGNVMYIFRIVGKFGQTSFEFILYMSCEIWKSFPQTCFIYFKLSISSASGADQHGVKVTSSQDPWFHNPSFHTQRVSHVQGRRIQRSVSYTQRIHFHLRQAESLP